MISTKTTKVSQTLNLTVEPQRLRVDESVSIKVTGCVPGQKVRLRTHAYDDWQQEWTSAATFVADEVGEISLNRQKPISGSYQSIDPRGLFWSMHPVQKKHKIPLMINTHEPISISLWAETEGQGGVSTNIEMLFGDPGVVHQSIREHGLVGTLCYPEGPGPYPGVLIVSGSDAAICDNQAALLASHGYAAFTLAYFGHEQLPEYLVDIPLEYFEHAIQWLHGQEMVDETKLAVIGLSRGAELALLLASIHSAIKVVIAASPSSHLHSGLAQNDYSRAAWTRDSRPLPHLKANMDIFSGLAFLWHSLRHRALTLRPIFLATLEDEENLAEAAIPVEQIRGAVLLISGQDDQLWPSSLFAELVMQRLAAHHHPYPYRHLSYQKAGHFVCFPYGYPNLPPLVGSQRGLACGGNAPANALAIADSWREMLIFLRENFCNPLGIHPQEKEN